MAERQAKFEEKRRRRALFGALPLVGAYIRRAATSADLAVAMCPCHQSQRVRRCSAVSSRQWQVLQAALQAMVAHSRLRP